MATPPVLQYYQLYGGYTVPTYYQQLDATVRQLCTSNSVTAPTAVWNNWTIGTLVPTWLSQTDTAVRALCTILSVTPPTIQPPNQTRGAYNATYFAQLDQAVRDLCNANPLPPTPPGFASLPLTTEARTQWMGDSYVERGAGVYTATGALQGGYYIDAQGSAQGLWGYVAADPRFDSSIFYNAGKVYGAAPLDGADQGWSGRGIMDLQIVQWTDQAISRNPQIVCIDLGKNDINASVYTLLQLQTNYLATLAQFFAAKVWVVICTQAAFRNGGFGVTGDWSTGGPCQTQCNQFNAWLKTLVSQPGIAAVLDFTALDGTQTVGNSSFVSDGLHLNQYGEIQRLAVAWAAMKPLVTALPAINPIASTNLFGVKSQLGLNGTLSNCVVDPGVASNLQGVASNLRVAGTAADAAVTLVSKETTFPFTSVGSFTIASPGVVNMVAHGYTAGTEVVFNFTDTPPTGLTEGRKVYVSGTGITPDTFSVSNTNGGSRVNFSGSPTGSATAHTGYDAQVVTISPVNNATKIHGLSFTFTSSQLYSAQGLAAGDWVRVRYQITLDSSSIWSVDTDATGTAQPGRMHIVQSDAGNDQVYITDNFSGVGPGTTIVLSTVFQITATVSDQWQAGFGPLVSYRSDLGGTGVCKFQVQSMEKLSTDPRIAWGYPWS